MSQLSKIKHHHRHASFLRNVNEIKRLALSFEMRSLSIDERILQIQANYPSIASERAVAEAFGMHYKQIRRLTKASQQHRSYHSIGRPRHLSEESESILTDFANETRPSFPQFQAKVIFIPICHDSVLYSNVLYRLKRYGRTKVTETWQTLEFQYFHVHINIPLRFITI